jgi:hypothetical protein
MAIPSNFGTDYSRFFVDDGSPVPFPNPANDGQRVINARSRAERAGQPIGSGRLNPKTGKLEDPDSGFMRYIGEHPYVGAAMALAPGAAFALPGLMGGGAAASGSAGAAGGTTTMVAPGIPAVAGTGAGITAPLGGVTAAGAGAGTAAAAGGGSMLDKLKKSLTSTEGMASLASLIPMLAMAGGGNSGGGANGPGSEELRRIQAITEARMRRADPLHQVAVQLAYGRAPVSARQGVDLNNVRLPE